jgi:hypothetical protein
MAPPPEPLRQRGPGIRTRLVLLALATLLPVLLFAGIVAWRFAEAERAAVERDVLLRATALAREVEAEVATAASALRALSASAAFREPDPTGLQATLVAVAGILGGPIAVRDAEGRILLHSALPPDALPAATPLDAAFRAIPRDADPYVGDLATNPVSGEPVWGVILPARDADGRVRFLALGRHPRVLLPVLRRATPGPGWTTAVVDRASRIVIRGTGREEMLIGETAPSAFREGAGRVWRTVNPDGVPVVAAGAATAFGWTVGVSLPAAIVDAPLRRATFALGAMGLATLAAAAGLALLLGGRIARAVGALAGAAAALGAGRRAAVARSGLREVDEVAAALSEAASTAAARGDALPNARPRSPALSGLPAPAASRSR